ncbi:unnamed protein product [Candida parapsilosis]
MFYCLVEYMIFDKFATPFIPESIRCLTTKSIAERMVLNEPAPLLFKAFTSTIFTFLATP